MDRRTGGNREGSTGREGEQLLGSAIVVGADMGGGEMIFATAIFLAVIQKSVRLIGVSLGFP